MAEEVRTLKFYLKKTVKGFVITSDHVKVKAIDAKLAEAGALLIEPKAHEPRDFDMSRFFIIGVRS